MPMYFNHINLPLLYRSTPTSLPTANFMPCFLITYQVWVVVLLMSHPWDSNQPLILTHQETDSFPSMGFINPSYSHIGKLILHFPEGINCSKLLSQGLGGEAHELIPHPCYFFLIFKKSLIIFIFIILWNISINISEFIYIYWYISIYVSD